MSTSKILPIKREEVLDFSKTLHTRFWTVKDQPNPITIGSPDTTITETPDLLQFLEESQAEVICIMTESFQAPALINWCSKASEKKARIYLLTATQPTAALNLAGTCLLRFGLPIKGTLILTNPSQKDAKGMLSTAPLSPTIPAGTHIPLLELDTEQCQEAFHHFTFHFWQTAKQEILQRQGSPQDVTAAPFSPRMPEDHSPAITRLFETCKITHALVPAGTWDLSATQNATVLTGFNLQHPEQLGLTNKLHAQEHPSNVHYIAAAGEAYILWGSPPLQWTLKLNTKQSKHIAKAFDAWTKEAKYHYVPQATRREIVGDTILPLGPAKPLKIQEKGTTYQDLKSETLLPLAELQELKPSFNDDGISCLLTCAWTILPPLLPKESKRDPLYQKWEEEDKRFADRIAKSERGIAEAKQKADGVAEGLIRFLSRKLLGKNQKLNEVQTSLESIKPLMPSTMIPVERPKVFLKLAEVERSISDTREELDSSILEANQQREWEDKKSALEAQLQKQKAQLGTKKSEVQTKEETFQQQLAEKTQKWEAFLTQKGLSLEKLPKHKNLLEQQAGKQNEKKNPAEAKDAKRQLEELKEVDPSMLGARHKADQEELQREVTRLEAQVKKFEGDLEKLGPEFKPSTAPASSSGGLLKELSKEPEKPAESQEPTFKFHDELPRIGELFRHNDKRYLSIIAWEDFPIAQTESERLKAILVTQPQS